MEIWTHFEYTSGSNPYIAKTDDERKRVIGKWKRRKVEVEKVKEGFYLIHDREGAVK